MEARSLRYQHLPHRALKLAGANPLSGIERSFRDITRGISGGILPPEPAWEVLHWIPKAATSFTAPLLSNDVVIEKLSGCAPAALYALTAASSHPERFRRLAVALEPTILADGELLSQYLNWARETYFSLPQSLNTYRSALIQSPVHAIQFAIAAADTELPVEVLEWSLENAPYDAGAAWAVAHAQQADADQVRKTLVLDPFYATVAAATLGIQFSLDEFPEPLTGRQAFNLLINNAFSSPEDAEDLLYSIDPAWGLEWIIENDNLADRSILKKSLTGLTAWHDQAHPLLEVLMQSLRNVADSLKGDAGQVASGDNETETDDVAAVDDDEAEEDSEGDETEV